MSYNVSLKDSDTDKTIKLDKKHDIKGGTYAVGGTTEAWLNVTYNYASHFHRVLGNKGIRIIYGMTARESIPILKKAIALLNDDVSPNYWEPTEGNARQALQNLLLLGELFPDGVWAGD